MKKVMLFAAMVTVAFAACQKRFDPLSDPNESREIIQEKFDTVSLSTDQIEKLLESVEFISVDTKSMLFIDNYYDYEDYSKSYPVMLILFKAIWCGPCNLLIPRFYDVSKQYNSKVCVFAIADVDKVGNKVLNSCGIMSVPTIVVLKYGQVVDEVLGAVPGDEIKELVDKHRIN